MKKQLAQLNGVRDQEALHSILSALEADLGQLVHRLRGGIASNAEQALAADLIERKKKPRRPKMPWHERFELAQVVAIMDKAYPYGHPRGQRDSVIKAAAEYCGKSPRYVYNVLDEFNRDTLGKIKAMPSSMRVTKTYQKGKATIQESCLLGPRSFDHDSLVLLVEWFFARK